jgi:hypothetical protein
MKKLSNGTALRPNNILNKIIKILFQIKEFEKVLIKIINTCLIQKKIPEKWKKSNIYIIYKKNNPNNPLNYRPIALICTTYKIYSSLITKKLSNFMENNQAFSEIQEGFRRNRSIFAKIWTLRNMCDPNQNLSSYRQ